MELCSLDIRELSWAWQHSWSSEDEDSEAEAEGDNTGDSAEAGEDTVQPPTQEEEEEDTMESLHPASAEAAAGHTEATSAPRLLSSGTASAAQEVNTASSGSDEAEEVTTEVLVEVTVEVGVEDKVEVGVEVTTEVLARLLCAEIVLDLLDDTFYISPPLPGHGGQEQEQEQEQEPGGQEVCEVILQEAVTSAVALVEVKSKGGNDISL